MKWKDGENKSLLGECTGLAGHDGFPGWLHKHVVSSAAAKPPLPRLVSGAWRHTTRASMACEVLPRQSDR